MGFLHIANDSGPDPFANLADAFTGVTLVAHLGNYSVFIGSFSQFSCFEDIMCKRFFHVNMFAPAHAFHCGVGMHMVRGGNQYSINILVMLVQHFSEIPERRHIGKLFVGFGSPLIVYIRKGNQILAGRAIDIGIAFSTSPYSSDIKFVAGSLAS